MPAGESDDTDFVMSMVKDQRVGYVRLWFVDVLGIAKSLSVPVGELPALLEEGLSLDGSSLEAGAQLFEHDIIAQPDPQTFQVLPWQEEAPRAARMFCSMRLPDGSPSPCDTRRTLQVLLEELAARGYSFQVGCEPEFYLFSPAADEAAVPVPLDTGGYFDQTPRDAGRDFRRETIGHLELLGIPVKSSHHEVGPSQHEIGLRHSDALSMADAVITFRLTVKEVAQRQGTRATFMPKPLDDEAGSGMHVHASLFDREQNAFSDPDSAPLSPLGRSFMAGILHHAAEIAAVTNPWVNSYKRLHGGFEAPDRAWWTRNGRSALVRVPSSRPERAEAPRIEVRAPDAACNPYLAFAMLLAAGLRGVDQGLEPPQEGEREPPPDSPPLPDSLQAATDLFAASSLAKETLGEELHAVHIASQRLAWRAYQRPVTDFERRQYLAAL